MNKKIPMGAHTTRQPEVSSPNISKLSVIFMLIIVGIVAVLYLTDRMYHPDKNRFTSVQIRGVLQGSDTDVIQNMVESNLHGNFFTADLDRLEKRISEIPWIPSVTMRRQWPSTLIIEVAETKPMARWGDRMWLNFTGDLIEIPRDFDDSYSSHLPTLAGPEGETDTVWKAYRKWSNEFGSLGLTLKGLRLDNNRIWYLELSLGALLRNRSDTDSNSVADTDQAVHMTVEDEYSNAHILRFVRSLDQHLIDQFDEMQSVDLRYPNGFAIHWKNEQSLPVREKLNSLVVLHQLHNNTYQ